MSLQPQPSRGREIEKAHAALLEEIREEARQGLVAANAARWRAGALAEAIFGPGVVPRLRDARGAAGFQALVELEVPFRSLEAHREQEGRFLWEAGRDAVLAQVNTLFVFTPAERGP